MQVALGFLGPVTHPLDPNQGGSQIHLPCAFLVARPEHVRSNSVLMYCTLGNRTYVTGDGFLALCLGLNPCFVSQAYNGSSFGCHFPQLKPHKTEQTGSLPSLVLEAALHTGDHAVF